MKSKFDSGLLLVTIGCLIFTSVKFMQDLKAERAWDEKRRLYLDRLHDIHNQASVDFEAEKARHELELSKIKNFYGNDMRMITREFEESSKRAKKIEEEYRKKLEGLKYPT